jgi:3-oxoacyl-[acyl-carrier protein] reductase
MSRIALVTGGAGGLGLATSRRFAEDGMTVVVADMDINAAQACAASLPGSGHRGIAINVALESSVRETFEEVEAQVGPIGVLANFAGVLGRSSGTERPLISTTELEEWERVFAVNARGCFLCIREIAQRRERKPVEHGRIITISSTAAQLGGYQANSAYISSKGAVLSLTKAAARELSRLGITVNAIAPGPIDTPMLHLARGTSAGDSGFAQMTLLPAGRIGRPDEIAAAASYLASIEAGFVTGATLDVNGGLRMQ